MDNYVKNFIRASLVYLVLGVFFGVAMAVYHDLEGYLSFGHVHLNLVGFMAMMIFGVGYHILPKFSGRLVYSTKLAVAQFWVSNIGLIGLVTFRLLYTVNSEVQIFEGLFISSAVLSLAGMAIFAYNLLRTIK